MADGRNKTFHGSQGRLPSALAILDTHFPEASIPSEKWTFSITGTTRFLLRELLYVVFVSTRGQCCLAFSHGACYKTPSVPGSGPENGRACFPHSVQA